jgi:hypothetical protein
LREKKDTLLQFNADRIAQAEDYFSYSTSILGLRDVGHTKVSVPTTVYQKSGDETSGVAGLLFPDGKFIEASKPRVGTQALYWEFDETLAYEQIPGEVTPEGTPRVVGNSWRTGEVVWDGSVAGCIEIDALDGDDEDLHRQVVNRRVRDAALGDEWPTTGELWKALERGTKMYAGQQPGATHQIHSEAA